MFKHKEVKSLMLMMFILAFIVTLITELPAAIMGKDMASLSRNIIVIGLLFLSGKIKNSPVWITEESIRKQAALLGTKKKALFYSVLFMFTIGGILLGFALARMI